jgi:Phage tail lysozyme
MSGKLLPQAVFAALLAMVAGCSGPGAEALGESQQAASTAFANDKTAFDYFIAKGLNNFQAAAVVGNLDQESGVDPAIHQAGGGVGRGIAQWSTGARWDTTDKDNVLQFATQKGQSATSLSLQLDFIWYELTSFPEYGLAQLKASANLTDATTAFEDLFEGCVYANYPECALPSRINFAKSVFNAYGADVGGGSGGAAGSAGTGGVSAGGASGSSNGGGAGASGSAASGSAGASGAGTAGSSSPSAGGTASSSAGSNATGGAATPGSPTTAGNPSTPGSAGASSPGSAGNLGLVGLTPETNDSNCAFSPPNNAQSSHAVLYLLGALGSISSLRRRKR